MSDAAIETPSQSTGEEEYDWDAADERALEALAAPIDPREIKVREGQGGRQLRYVQVPTVVRRLNEVLGRAGWGLEVEVYSNCMRCRLRITLPSGRVIARDGIGGYPERQGGRGISDEDLPKGAESDAMKRAAVKYGIAAELYEDAHEIPQGRGQYRGPGGPPSPATTRAAITASSAARPAGICSGGRRTIIASMQLTGSASNGTSQGGWWTGRRSRFGRSTRR
jgi:hypothetical protein